MYRILVFSRQLCTGDDLIECSNFLYPRIECVSRWFS